MTKRSSMERFMYIIKYSSASIHYIVIDYYLTII